MYFHLLQNYNLMDAVIMVLFNKVMLQVCIINQLKHDIIAYYCSSQGNIV